MSAVPTPGVWSCRLCGEAVFSVGAPARCPACGALPDLLVEPEEPLRILGRGVPLPDAWKEAGARAVRQEVDTSELYSRVAMASPLPRFRTTFRALSKVEGRHATLLSALFQVQRPPPELRPDLSGVPEVALLDMVEAREDDTIRLYEELVRLTAGTDVAEVFRALIAIEADHNDLAAVLRSRLA